MSKPQPKSGEIDESKLFQTDEKEYGDDYREHLLEQYKLHAEMSDDVSTRRVETNKYFLSINALLVTAIGLMSAQDSILFVDSFWRGVVAFSGLLMCVLWWSMIRSFKSLNRAKFQVINAIERRLPSAGFLAEWDFIERLNEKEKHREMTTIEIWIPVVFGVIYIVMIFLIILSVFFPIFPVDSASLLI